MTALLSSPVATSAQDSGSCSSPDFPAPILCQRAGLDSIRANFVFLVDESGSMTSGSLWEPVKTALRSLASAVPRSDQVRLVLFSGDSREHSQPWGATDPDRQAWARSVEALPPARGQRTDLGRALQAALDIVSSEPPDRQQFVIILTDGAQDPDSQSPYDPAGLSPEWADLRARVEAAIAGRPVSITLLRVSDAADRSLLSQSVPDLRVIDAVGGDAVQNWIQDYAQAFQVTKLRLAIERDLRGPAARLTLEEGRAVRTAAGRAQGVDLLAVERRRLIGVKQVGSVEVSNGVGATMRISDLDLESSGPHRVTLTDRSVAPFLPPGIAPRSFEEIAVVDVQRDPADELERLTIPSEGQDSIRVAIAYRAGGWTLSWTLYLVTAAGLLVLAILVAVWIKWSVHRPSLDGWVLVRQPTQGNEESETIPLAGTVHSVQTEGHELFRLRAISHRGKTRIVTEWRDDSVRGQVTRTDKGGALQRNSRVKIPGHPFEYSLNTR